MALLYCTKNTHNLVDKLFEITQKNGVECFEYVWEGNGHVTKASVTEASLRLALKIVTGISGLSYTDPMRIAMKILTLPSKDDESDRVELIDSLVSIMMDMRNGLNVPDRVFDALINKINLASRP
jgi:hypothetical protein